MFWGDKMRRLNIAGQRFGKLIAIKPTRTNKGLEWICNCDCGGTRTAYSKNLKAGEIKSCGCLLASLRHGMIDTKTYSSWRAMKNRCLNTRSIDYKDYGGRGIGLCDRWMVFTTFYEDMGDRPKGTSIERVDNNKGYSPDNCKWATPIEQSRNSRLRKRNISGFSGVSRSNNKKRWVATIRTVGKHIFLGTFDTIPEAAEARRWGEIKYWGRVYSTQAGW